MKRKFNRVMGALLLTASLMAMPVTAYAEDATTTSAEAETVNLKGTYHARLGFQAMTADSKLWVERLAYYDVKEGTLPHSGKEATKDLKEYQATYADAVIEGNGTYTVTMTGASIGDVTDFTQLQVATDIPKSDTIQFTDLVVKVGGVVQTTYKTVMKDSDKVSGAYECLLAYNNWRQALKDDANCMDPKCIPTGSDVSMELTFTVSGFDYDKEAETTTVADTQATTAATKDNASSSKGLTDFQAILLGTGGAVVFFGIVITAVVIKKKKK